MALREARASDTGIEHQEERATEGALRQAIAAIEYALGSGSTRMFRSTWGEMLERAHNLAHSHTGRRHPRPRGGEMPVKHERGEPSYEMRLSDSRIAWAVVLLAEVARGAPRLRATLELYHGDAGARWARLTDREQSLFPLTTKGQDIVRAARSKFHTSADLRDDELIAQDVALQATAPNDLRRMRHKLMRREADELRGAAWAALASASLSNPPLPKRWAE